MRHLRIIPLIIVCITFVSSFGFSQDSEFLRGRLLDAQTSEPVAFATIRIKDRAIGVISNQDGSFQIPEKFKEYGDVLEISSMGYTNKDIKISGLSPFDINVIRLDPGVFELQEAVVEAKGKMLSAQRIVQTAIDRIPVNYPTYPFSLIGYYRDYQFENRNYVNLNEGIMEVFDQGFPTNDVEKFQAQIYEYDENTEFKRDTLAEQPYDYKSNNKVIDKAYLSSYGGNEFTILRIHDAIRNYRIGSYDFVNRLETDFIKQHFLKKEAESSIDGEGMYVISAKKKTASHTINGKIYISKTNFAIHKLEYTIYLLHEATKKSSKSTSDNIDRLILDTTVEYRPIGSDMFLNLISFNNTFRLAMPPKYGVKEVTVDMVNSRFVIKMNKIGTQKDLSNSKNYSVKFKGKKVKIDNVEIAEDTVFIYPKLTKKNTIFEQIHETSSDSSEPQEEMLDFGFGKIKDKEGNVLNQAWFKRYNQFREFFVQRVNKGKRAEGDGLLMKKTLPLYHELQPRVRPDNFDDYWMNTPLQSTKSQAIEK